MILGIGRSRELEAEAASRAKWAEDPAPPGCPPEVWARLQARRVADDEGR